MVSLKTSGAISVIWVMGLLGVLAECYAVSCGDPTRACRLSGRCVLGMRVAKPRPPVSRLHVFMLVAVIVVGLPCVVANAYSDNIRAAYLARQLRSDDATVRKRAATELLRLGPRGFRHLETRAFSREIAKRGAPESMGRQEAL